MISIIPKKYGQKTIYKVYLDKDFIGQFYQYSDALWFKELIEKALKEELK